METLDIDADIRKWQDKAAKIQDDPDWQAHCAEQIEAIRHRRAVGVSIAIRDALRAMDTPFAVRFARALASAILAAGGPNTTRVWSKGSDVRVYLPNDQYLGVGSDGSVHTLARGRATYQPSALYPAWRRAVRDGLTSYRAALPALLTEKAAECAAEVDRLTA